MDVPDHIVGFVAGDPRDGAWEPVFPLLTVDADGFPRECLLSRAEVWLDGRTVRCVLRARRTRANLDRVGRGLLVVVHGESAYSLRLSVLSSLGHVPAGVATAVELTVDGVEEDTLHIPLRPMAYRASARVRRVERTDDNRKLLEQLDRPDETGRGRT